MYPLIYHLGIDDYFPNEDFEPHLFEHRAAWRRDGHRPSVLRRVASALMRAVRPGRGPSEDAPVPRAASRLPGEPAIRWG